MWKYMSAMRDIKKLSWGPIDKVLKLNVCKQKTKGCVRPSSKQKVGDIRNERKKKIGMVPASMPNAACLVSQLHLKRPSEDNGKNVRFRAPCHYDSTRDTFEYVRSSWYNIALSCVVSNRMATRRKHTDSSRERASSRSSLLVITLSLSGVGWKRTIVEYFHSHTHKPTAV